MTVQYAQFGCTIGYPKRRVGKELKMDGPKHMNYCSIRLPTYHVGDDNFTIHCIRRRPGPGCHIDATGWHLHINIVSYNNTICLGPFAAKKLSEELSQEVDQLFVTLAIETLTQ